MRAFNSSGSTNTAEVENQKIKILKIKMYYYVYFTKPIIRENWKKCQTGEKSDALYYKELISFI